MVRKCELLLFNQIKFILLANATFIRVKRFQLDQPVRRVNHFIDAKAAKYFIARIKGYDTYGGQKNYFK